jgi:hypothetical protein
MTAVEYLEEEFDKYIAYNVEGCHKTEKFTYNDMLKAFAEALELEKQQIIEAYNFSNIPHLFKWDAEQYYEHLKNETE